jgi:hypothetical protein
MGKAYIRLEAKRVSFDYDGVLSTDKGKELAAQKIKDGYHVYIITAREESDGSTVYNTAAELGISSSDVLFTNGRDKWPYCQQHLIDTHYDNNAEQVRKIITHTNTRAILYYDR